MDQRDHWERIYAAKDDADLSWFQPQPDHSIALMKKLEPLPARVLDIGGGQSAFASEALAAGVSEVTVDELSASALQRGRQRAGALAPKIRWIEGDVLNLPQLGPFDLWHDRAVFHFFTEAADRQKYVEAATRSVQPGGHAIIATFALDGPERCSGLEVRRYDAASLAAEFGPAFTLIESKREEHHTPWGSVQAFTWVVLMRKG